MYRDDDDLPRIDLHGYTVDEALRVFVERYNVEARRRWPEPIQVIHGYGASGEGGEIRRRLRKYLKENSECLSYDQGERLMGNPGVTIVYPDRPLPEVTDVLAGEILAYCRPAKPMKSIVGKFRRYGAPEVKQIVKRLEREGKLRVVYKGRYKCYEATITS